MSGRDRNQPCPCGSGRKAKHCPGPHLEEIEAAYRENEERDYARRVAETWRINRGRGGRLGVLALAAMAIDGLSPPVRR